MKKLLAIGALVFFVVAPAWGPTAEAQKANPIDICAVSAHFRVRNLGMADGWGRVHTFSSEPGAFVGNIYANEAAPQNSSGNLSLSGRGYVLVDCDHPNIVHFRCAPNFWSCVELLAGRD
jgi:hypothetical protein